MFSMLSMLQKEGNAAQESPFIANAVRTKHSAGSAQVPQGRNSTSGATAQCRGSAQTPQGRNRHSAGGAHKLHKGDTARQVRQHSAGERTSSAGRQDTARATAQESRNEGGRLSEVATLAVIVLEAYD